MGDCKLLSSSSEPVRFFTNLLVLRIYVENELFALLSIVRYCESALIQAPTTRLDEGSVSLKLLAALNFVNLFHDGDLDLFFFNRCY